jgi:signal transduction histidine kinase
MVLAALPWRLLQGEVAVVSPGGWTPMRKTLAVAWVGAVLAALAAMVLLRGVVKLSERRASFVSSVTHELRTPLTTFSLYSDLLAEGMVQDEEKKQAYLDTLRKESARLTHLVENVLAYSRIERGSARARVEQVEVGALIDRMCERLRKRAEEVGMELRCEVPGELARLTVEVDTTAVEQIIFNLVDNASKYASGEGCGKIITLRALERGRQVVFQVSDLGKGILVGERNRLFRAFHKSAQEAAHTKPGVGLGLALSRRLARALGGDLRIVDSDEGACFELQLSH